MRGFPRLRTVCGPVCGPLMGPRGPARGPATGSRTGPGPYGRQRWTNTATVRPGTVNVPVPASNPDVLTTGSVPPA